MRHEGKEQRLDYALLPHTDGLVLLPCLPPLPSPQVMQALVEHFVAAGQPEEVERCVLKMDLLSLDLNQVLRWGAGVWGGSGWRR